MDTEYSAHEASIVSFINMKGGVGKTTLCVGVADYLSSYEDMKVLIIDIDPQFNATQTLMDTYSDLDYFEDILPEEKTINKLFKPQTEFGAAQEIPQADSLIIKLNKNLDILCGDLNLVLVNKSSDYRQVKKLRRFINENNLREQYDLILIDCPPTLTLYTDSALLASDYYIIPNRIDRYSIIGISSLQTAIGNLIREEECNLKCLGLIYTMLEDNLTQKQIAIKESFESQDEVDDIMIFTASSSVVRDIQVGKKGPLSTNYQKSLNDTKSISLELVDKISMQEAEGE